MHTFIHTWISPHGVKQRTRGFDTLVVLMLSSQHHSLVVCMVDHPRGCKVDFQNITINHQKIFIGLSQLHRNKCNNINNHNKNVQKYLTTHVGLHCRTKCMWKSVTLDTGINIKSTYVQSHIHDTYRFYSLFPQSEAYMTLRTLSS